MRFPPPPPPPSRLLATLATQPACPPHHPPPTQVLPLLVELLLWVDTSALDCLWSNIHQLTSRRSVAGCLLAARCLSLCVRRLERLQTNLGAARGVHAPYWSVDSEDVLYHWQRGWRWDLVPPAAAVAAVCRRVGDLVTANAPHLLHLALHAPADHVVILMCEVVALCRVVLGGLGLGGSGSSGGSSGALSLSRDICVVLDRGYKAASIAEPDMALPAVLSAIARGLHAGGDSGGGGSVAALGPMSLGHAGLHASPMHTARALSLSATLPSTPVSDASDRGTPSFEDDLPAAATAGKASFLQCLLSPPAAVRAATTGTPDGRAPQVAGASPLVPSGEVAAAVPVSGSGVDGGGGSSSASSGAARAQKAVLVSASLAATVAPVLDRLVASMGPRERLLLAPLLCYWATALPDVSC
jgi:hypothetical protein